MAFGQGPQLLATVKTASAKAATSGCGENGFGQSPQLLAAAKNGFGQGAQFLATAKRASANFAASLDVDKTNLS